MLGLLLIITLFILVRGPTRVGGTGIRALFCHWDQPELCCDWRGQVAVPRLHSVARLPVVIRLGYSNKIGSIVINVNM
jgi:hypothetical protein